MHPNYLIVLNTSYMSDIVLSPLHLLIHSITQPCEIVPSQGIPSERKNDFAQGYLYSKEAELALLFRRPGLRVYHCALSKDSSLKREFSSRAILL